MKIINNSELKNIYGLNLSNNLTIHGSTKCDGSNLDESMINKSIDNVMKQRV